MNLPWVAAGLFVALSLRAAESIPDKSQFTLFNPTPRSLMREMSTDRPDQTESAYSVDAGHFQVEADVFSYTYDKSDGVRFENFSPSVLNLKVGLLNNVDLQLGIAPYIYERTRNEDGTIEDHSGFGDMVLRTKVNLWGNDGGRTALSAMPFIKIPTATDSLGNGAVEGGFIFPMAIALPGEWGMTIMTEFDIVQNSTDSDYHGEFINSITVGHAIVGPLYGYVEFFSIVSSERDSDWQGFFDFGFTYALTDDLQLDAGMNIGVTRSAPDWNPFIGLSFRY